MIFVPKEIEDELCEADQLEIEREVIEQEEYVRQLEREAEQEADARREGRM